MANNTNTVTINGVTYQKAYFDIFKYVMNAWMPEWEDIEDLTIEDLWETMKEHESDEEINYKQ